MKHLFGHMKTDVLTGTAISLHILRRAIRIMNEVGSVAAIVDLIKLINHSQQEGRG